MLIDQLFLSLQWINYLKIKWKLIHQTCFHVMHQCVCFIYNTWKDKLKMNDQWMNDQFHWLGCSVLHKHQDHVVILHNLISWPHLHVKRLFSAQTMISLPRWPWSPYIPDKNFVDITWWIFQCMERIQILFVLYFWFIMFIYHNKINDV